MDKYEYKVRADEIKALISEGDFAEAVKIADTIDWRRVKSVMMLCTISDLYKINRRYQESKDILLLAYEKHPTGRLIVYSLCELSIKMEEYVQAIEYYKEFVQIAPKDTSRFILQYRLYEAQEVSLEERIAVLEEFKKRDYREKWAYELAYLYHRIGLTTKCVEECDEMFLWFGEGKYVLKALELKALHTPLNADQQAKYDLWMTERDAENEEEPEEDAAAEETEDDERGYDEDEEEDDLSGPALTTELPEVKTVDLGQYNTMNLQMALAESMKEILTDETGKMPETSETGTVSAPAPEETEDASHKDPIVEKIIAPLLQETTEMPQVTLSQDTDELQEITAQPAEEPVTETYAPQPQAPTIRIAESQPQMVTAAKPQTPAAGAVEVQSSQAPTIRIPDPQPIVQTADPQPTVSYPNPVPQETYVENVETRRETTSSRYDEVLSQEYDGQIRLVVPDVKAIEKQITGQLSIEDIMAEWEAMKKSNEQKRMEAVRQRILEHTGSLFADFDEATKSGLLEQLEKAFVAAIMKESGKPSIKKVIIPEEAEQELEASKVSQQTDTVKEMPKEKAKELPEPEEEEAALAESVLTYEESGEDEELREIEEESADIEEEPEEQAEEPVAAVMEEYEPEEEMSDTDETEQETAEEIKAQPAAAEVRPQQGGAQSVRELTEEEKELFGQYVHHRKSREQLIHTLDNMSMAAYTGNVILTGEEGGGTLSLAKCLIREMQYNDSNFSGKVAKISGTVLNKKDIAKTLSRINNGALIIEKAADLKGETVARLAKELEKDNMGLLLILEDTKQRMNQFLIENSILNYSFELRIDIEPLDDEALVAYAKQYAGQREYSIDEFGILALHTRIADMQTSDHEVTVAEVRELVDEAIYYANKKTPKHFVDVLLAKRYDDDDMIILRENDFMHY
ncbi:MAG: hypothetical protein NC314_02285 [Roseburia sp.]|nr:hypothetical protein [Roseburia sp.]MCM1241643.1 hypothetical protein [Roseburia sp.]